MGIDFSVILYTALAINLVIGLAVGTVCFLVVGVLFRKISDRVRSAERTRTPEEAEPVMEWADMLTPFRQPGVA
jgi:hypothetical protein